MRPLVVVQFGEEVSHANARLERGSSHDLPPLSPAVDDLDLRRTQPVRQNIDQENMNVILNRHGFRVHYAR
jgi:hypothetical protein